MQIKNKRLGYRLAINALLVKRWCCLTYCKFGKNEDSTNQKFGKKGYSRNWKFGKKGDSME